VPERQVRLTAADTPPPSDHPNGRLAAANTPTPTERGGAVPTVQAAGAPPALLVESREAARLLAVSPRTLWSLTARGDLPCVRIGRAVRYSLADLESFVGRLRAEARRSSEASNGHPGGSS
jgi:excisionase family DNA binding protein